MSCADDVAIVPVARGWEREFDDMLAEYRRAGEDPFGGVFVVAWQGLAAFADLAERLRNGGYPRPDVVPTDVYLIVEGKRVAGEITVRHRLNADLEVYGGHIGYGVRPSARNRGVATAALRLALARLRELGVTEALLTTDPENRASARVMEKCGGRRDADGITALGTVTRRYWIPTSV